MISIRAVSNYLVLFGALLLIQVVFIQTSSATTPNYNAALGINTNEALEVDASVPFVDLFRLSLPFEEARPWFTKGKPQYDNNGWAKNLNGGQAGTRFLSHVPVAALPKGEYTVLYDGEGEITYSASAQLVRREQGKDIIKLKPMPQKNELYPTYTATLFIKKLNPRNHLRNIRILMPGGICASNPFKRVTHQGACRSNDYQSFEQYHNQITFNPDYLNFMKDFKVVRFMNMSGVTRNNLRYWKDRPTLSKATWAGKEGTRGVPIEVLVKLANILNVDPWLNIPHNADNAFIYQYAQLVNRTLKPSLRVYLEYTNEAWNNVFVPQAEHMKQTGYKLKLDRNRNVAGMKYYSQQSVKIFRVWEKVFKGTQRLIRVMGGMTTDSKLTETLLGYQNAYKFTDALAIAPYFHFPQDRMEFVKSVNDVFNELARKDNRYSVKNTLRFVQRQAQISKGYGVDLIAYEGGQHLVHHKTHSMTQGATPHLYKANKDKRMAQLYYQLLNGWKKAGGKLFVAFSAPRPTTWHGSWGIKEHIAETVGQAPKYAALLAFMRSTPCWWKNCSSGNVVRLAKPNKIPKSLITGKAHKTATKVVNIPMQVGSRSNLHKSVAHNLETLIQGTIANPRDLTARWRANWDAQNLNLWIGVVDERLITDSKNTWADDSIEVYIDADLSSGEAYDKLNDFHLSFRLGDKKVSAGGSTPQKNLTNIAYLIKPNATGYQLEVKIPWNTLGVSPRAGNKIGLDIQVNDDDNGDVRDAKVSWNAYEDIAWKAPRIFGQIVLSPASYEGVSQKVVVVESNTINQEAVRREEELIRLEAEHVFRDFYRY